MKIQSIALIFMISTIAYCESGDVSMEHEIFDKYGEKTDVIEVGGYIVFDCKAKDDCKADTKEWVKLIHSKSHDIPARTACGETGEVQLRLNITPARPFGEYFCKVGTYSSEPPFDYYYRLCSDRTDECKDHSDDCKHHDSPNQFCMVNTRSYPTFQPCFADFECGLSPSDYTICPADVSFCEAISIGEQYTYAWAQYHQAGRCSDMFDGARLEAGRRTILFNEPFLVNPINEADRDNRTWSVVCPEGSSVYGSTVKCVLIEEGGQIVNEPEEKTCQESVQFEFPWTFFDGAGSRILKLKCDYTKDEKTVASVVGRPILFGTKLKANFTDKYAYCEVEGPVSADFKLKNFTWWHMDTGVSVDDQYRALPSPSPRWICNATVLIQMCSPRRRFEFKITSGIEAAKNTTPMSIPKSTTKSPFWTKGRVAMIALVFLIVIVWLVAMAWTISYYGSYQNRVAKKKEERDSDEETDADVAPPPKYLDISKRPTIGKTTLMKTKSGTAKSITPEKSLAASLGSIESAAPKKASTKTTKSSGVKKSGTKKASIQKKSAKASIKQKADSTRQSILNESAVSDVQSTASKK